MAEFNIRTDSVDVEQIMRQIRARIKEKRGVDYTEQQIQELANVKLERFLDPKGVRSDLVEQFKRARGTSPEPPNYGFEDTTLYETHRGLVRFMRRLLRPLLKMMFNPNPIVHVLHMQGQINNINAQQFRVREELDALYYEVIHNLVLEVTRLGIETKNLKMRLESFSSRMDFDERRARALEGVVQYKAGTGPAREPEVQAPARRAPEPARQAPQRAQPQRPRDVQPREAPPRSQPTEVPQVADADTSDGGAPEQQPGEGTGTAPGTVRRRRRRRRGRRGGRGRGPGEGTTPAESTPSADDPTAAAALGADAAPDAEGASGHKPQRDDDDSEGDSSDSRSDSDAGDDEGPEPSDSEQ